MQKRRIKCCNQASKPASKDPSEALDIAMLYGFAVGSMERVDRPKQQAAACTNSRSGSSKQHTVDSQATATAPGRKGVYATPLCGCAAPHTTRSPTSQVAVFFAAVQCDGPRIRAHCIVYQYAYSYALYQATDEQLLPPTAHNPVQAAASPNSTDKQRLCAGGCDVIRWALSAQAQPHTQRLMS